MRLQREFNATPSSSDEKQRPLLAVDDCSNTQDREFASVDAATSAMTFYSIAAEQCISSLGEAVRRERGKERGLHMVERVAGKERDGEIWREGLPLSLLYQQILFLLYTYFIYPIQ